MDRMFWSQKEDSNYCSYSKSIFGFYFDIADFYKENEALRTPNKKAIHGRKTRKQTNRAAITNPPDK